MTFEITITSTNNGVKPKNFLKKTLDVNYNQLIKAIKNKRITLNTKKIKEDDVLKEGDIIKIWDKSITLRKNSQKEISSKDIKNLHINTLLKHQDFLILNKPPGVIVQGAYDNTLSLSKHLRYLEIEKHLDSHSLFHVHRLDKDTSGCLVIGIGKENIRKLNSLFQQKSVKKIYQAICCGHFKEKEKLINLHLTRNDPNKSRDTQFIRSSATQTKVPKVIIKKNGKLTTLKYKVIKEFEKNNQRLSLVEIELITGFMHQIRVTFNHLGHSILADTMYCNSRVNEEFKNTASRQLLHASSIQFNWKNEDIKINCKLPKDFEEILQN